MNKNNEIDRKYRNDFFDNLYRLFNDNLDKLQQLIEIFKDNEELNKWC